MMDMWASKIAPAVTDLLANINKAIVEESLINHTLLL
jgi:hypothetical protein